MESVAIVFGPVSYANTIHAEVFIMKKLFCLVITGLVLSSTTCLAGENEIRFLPCYLSPGIDDSWSYATGLEAQYVMWKAAYLGIAFAGGAVNWQVSDSIKVNVYTAYKLRGSATTFPLGASVLFRPTLAVLEEDITFESGLRYVFVLSDVDARVQDGYSDTGSGSVDIDDGLLAVIAGDVAFPVSSKLKLGFGGGYQFDLSKGSTTLSGTDIKYDNRMKGCFLRLGVHVKL